MIQTSHELAAVADGTRVTVEGRYERWHPDMRPPDEVPVTARVVLVGGSGLLIGRYGDPESRRPDAELAQLDGGVVQISGTLAPTRTLDGAVPGFWTGGGPQLVDVEPPVLVQARPSTAAAPDAFDRSPAASAISSASSAAPRGPVSPVSPVGPVSPVSPVGPFTYGGLARRALAYGGSLLPVLALVVFGLGICACSIAGFYAYDHERALLAVVGVGVVALVGGYHLVIRALARREVRRLVALGWFEVAPYLAVLDQEGGLGVVLTVELVAVPTTLPPLRADATVTISGTTVALRSPMLETKERLQMRGHEGRSSNRSAHRWVRSVIRSLAASRDVQILRGSVTPR